MPIVIDANRSGDFTYPLANHAPEIISRINKRQMAVAVGGRLLKELAKTKLRELLVEWQRIGQLRLANNVAVDQYEAKFNASPLLSDDPHVLALVCVSKARLVYTFDKPLMQDLKNVNLVKPKGKIVAPTTPLKVALPLFDKFGA